MMKFQRMVLGACAAAGLALSAPIAPAQEDRAAPIPVRTLVLTAPEAAVARQFFGQVAARDTVELAFEVGGRLDHVDLVEGRAVSQGSLLAALELGPFERAVERAALDLAQAQRDLDRAATLAARNVAATVDVDMLRTARDLADVALRDARAALEDARLVAPFDGMIAARLTHAEAIVEPGQPVVRLHDLSELRVEVDLPERVLRAVGDPEAVTFVGLLPGGGAEFPLALREFRAETGPVGQSYRVSLAVLGEDLPPLLPGQSVVVRAELPVAEPGPVVPATAIATTPEGATYVVAVEAGDPGLVARHVAVDVGAPTGSALVVEGVETGAEIVAIGAQQVPDGAPLARYAGLIGGSE
ncbi:efflux RND transporter periplasmic adaptor subunit [Roseicyclus marinus]|uniref:efflux RND transporter periplasmic adaptor subunit n=1 Tax=Roseicyclus marinus TaxID=2161673 RepID=UPI0024105C0E|nr:efflux RND transporter periplasmic adaptor subunit [Roseicyclus marinus]MDG3040645.1 efflux RND transporter periplasmic adaptor subunit [Roseicyclus marinus]